MLFIEPVQQSSFTELDLRLIIPYFNPIDDPIANLNMLMAFVTTTFGPRFPQTNNQLRTSSNPRNQATIQDGRGVNRQGVAGQARLVKCYNCQRKELISFQTDDLDAFYSDYDDTPSAKAVLMANISSYDSDVLSEVPFHDTNIEHDMSYQKTEYPVVECTSSSPQQDELITVVIEEMSSQVAKCNKVQQENLIVNDTLTAELERYKEQVKLFEQRQKLDLNDREEYIDGQLRKVIVDRNAKVVDFETQIHSLKLQLNATVKSHKTLSTTLECLKKESKQKEDKYLDEVNYLQKKKKALDNVVYKMARQKVPALYDGHTIVKTHDALSVTDTEETLKLAKKSRLKMLAKQNDQCLKEKKVNIAPVDYVSLNKLSEHFVKHFMPKKQLSAERAFWL
ncbi:hypothetical protein Tco_0695788 [Tanacetum coccineum]